MENANTEPANQMASFFSWIELSGLLLFLSSRFFFRETSWLLYLGFFLVCSGAFYKLYSDWKAGRKKSLRNRFVVLLIALAAGLIVGFIAGENK